MTDAQNHDNLFGAGTDFKPSHILDAIKPAKASKRTTSLKHLQKYIDAFHYHHADIGLSETSLANNLPYEVVCDDNFFYVAGKGRNLPHLSKTLEA